MAQENTFMITEIDTGGYLGLQKESQPIPPLQQETGQISPIQQKKIEINPNYEAKNAQVILPRIQTEQQMAGKSFQNNTSASINNNSTSAINRSSILGSTFQTASKLDIIKRMMEENSNQDKKVMKMQSKQQNQSLSAIRSISVNQRSAGGYLGVGPVTERGTILTVLENYQQHIEQDYEKMYHEKKKAEFQFDKDLRNIENKKSLFFEVNQKQEILFKQKKCLNTIMYEIKQQEQRITELKELWDQMNQRGEKVEELVVELGDLEAQLDALDQNLEDQVYKTETLNHMLAERNRINLEIKARVAQHKENMVMDHHNMILIQVQENIHEKLISSLQVKHDRAFEQKKKARDLPQQFENQIKDELSEFGDQMALHSILKGKERKRFQENEQQRRKKESLLQKERDRIEKETLKKIQEEKKYEKDCEVQKELFLPLTQKVQIKVEKDLIPYYDHLNEKKDHLQKFREQFENQISAQKAIADETSQYLEKLKFYTKQKEQPKKSDGRDKNEADQLDPIEIEPELEQQLLNSEEIVFEKERKISKAQKLLDNVVVSLSRMLYQLQFQQNKNINFEVKRSTLESSISLIINNLETLLNLTKAQRVNHSVSSLSINTNPLLKRPPQYIGLNPNTYIVNSAKNSSVSEEGNVHNSIANFNKISNNNSIMPENQSDDQENDYWLDTRKRIKTFL